MISIGEGSKREALALIEQLGKNNITLRTLELTESQQWDARQSYSAGLCLDDLDRIMARTPEAEALAPVVSAQATER